MPGHDTLLGALPLLVLKVLHRRGPLHGYGLTAHIAALSGDALRVEEGSLYPALHRLEEDGLVKARWVTTDKKRRARVYELTPAGRRRLDAEEERWRTVTVAVAYVLKNA